MAGQYFEIDKLSRDAMYYFGFNERLNVLREGRILFSNQQPPSGVVKEIKFKLMNHVGNIRYIMLKDDGRIMKSE